MTGQGEGTIRPSTYTVHSLRPPSILLITSRAKVFQVRFEGFSQSLWKQVGSIFSLTWGWRKKMCWCCDRFCIGKEGRSGGRQLGHSPVLAVGGPGLWWWAWLGGWRRTVRAQSYILVPAYCFYLPEDPCVGTPATAWRHGGDVNLGRKRLPPRRGPAPSWQAKWIKSVYGRCSSQGAFVVTLTSLAEPGWYLAKCPPSLPPLQAGLGCSACPVLSHAPYVNILPGGSPCIWQHNLGILFNSCRNTNETANWLVLSRVRVTNVSNVSLQSDLGL